MESEHRGVALLKDGDRRAAAGRRGGNNRLYYLSVCSGGKWRGSTCLTWALGGGRGGGRAGPGRLPRSLVAGCSRPERPTDAWGEYVTALTNFKIVYDYRKNMEKN